MGSFFTANTERPQPLASEKWVRLSNRPNAKMGSFSDPISTAIPLNPITRAPAKWVRFAFFQIPADILMIPMRLTPLLLFAAAAFAQPADLVLRNGKIVTMNAAHPTAQAIAVRADKIAALGPDSDAAAGGLLLEITSIDSPGFGWMSPHPKTGNPWASTIGGFTFQESIVAVSMSSVFTYVPLNQATWSLSIVGYNANEWADGGSAVSGDRSLLSATSVFQVWGYSLYREISTRYVP